MGFLCIWKETKLRWELPIPSPLSHGRSPIRSPRADETSQAHQKESEGKDGKDEVKMVKMR